MPHLRILRKGEGVGHPFRGNQYATTASGNQYPTYRKPGKYPTNAEMTETGYVDKLMYDEARQAVQAKGAYWPGTINDMKVRSAMKAQICKELSERSGIPENEVSDILHDWAVSSNHGKSLHFQKTISDEFGLPMSDFQKKRMASEGIEWDKNSPRADKERKVARAMYEYTQEKLAAGPKFITLYRGVSYDGSGGKNNSLGNWFSEAKNKGGEGSVTKYRGNAIESWTSDRYVADRFSQGSVGRAVLAMRVPRETIFATASTGLGCLTEYETIVFGNPSGRPHEASLYHFSYNPGEY